MNICMMTNTYLPHVGGVARSVQTFTEDYRKMGHRVLVVAPEYSEDNGDAAEEEDVVRLPAIQQFNGSDFSVRLPMTTVFNSRIDEFAAQIIHSHHPFLVGDSALRVGANKHVPVIFTHHTLYEQYTHYVPFDSPTLKQFTIELCTLYANLCDGVIAPSESIATLIRQRGVEAPIEIIPTGVEVRAFATGNGKRFREAAGIAPDAFVVGHVGRLAPEKNLLFLARAVSGFLKATPGAVFLLIGAGPSEAEIRDVFQRAGLEDRLFMPGRRMGRQLCDGYRAMNLFAFASCSETQGLVLAEAMAAGLPVVALDASGAREVVRDGRNGFLLPVESTEETFAACLRRISCEAPLSSRLRAQARRTAQEFSRERSAQKAVQFYETIRTRTRRERAREKAQVWAALIARIEVEWNLFSEKAQAAVTAIWPEDEEEVTSNHSDRAG